MEAESKGEHEFDPRTWWTLGEAAERADVAHGEIQRWIDGGRLPFQVAWREGASVRVVRAGDLARLVPIVHSSGASGAEVSLEDRALRMGIPRSDLGSGLGPGGAAQEERDLVPPDGRPEEPHEAELRREVDRLRREVRELRASRDELGAELRRSERLRGEARPDSGPKELPAAAGIADEHPGLTSWSAAVAGLAIGLAAAVGWSQWEGTRVVEAAPRVSMARLDAVSAPAPSSATSPAPDDARPTAEPRPAGAPDVPLPFVPGESALEESVPETSDAAEVASLSAKSAASSAPLADVESPDTGPMASELAVASPQGTAFPVNLREVDPTAFIGGKFDNSSCAFAVLWEEGDPRYRWALGPCIGGHTVDGVARGTHRVDGAACCAHHAFVERMTSASRSMDALVGILEESRAARKEGALPPLVALRAGRSAKHFLEHALVADTGRGAWVAAGLDDGSGDHLWMPDPCDELGVVKLRSWVQTEEGAEVRPFELVVRLEDDHDGDCALSFLWLDG